MSKKADKKENSSSEKANLTEQILTSAPDYGLNEDKKEESIKEETKSEENTISDNSVPEHKSSKPAVKFEKPKASKTPKVVEIAPSVESPSVVKNNPYASLPLNERISKFNSEVLRSRFKTRHSLIEKAQDVFGSIEIIKGASDREVAFKVEGTRVPSEGVYFIRP